MTTKITQHINADKAGMIEYLRERADNVDNKILDNVGLTQKEIARRAGYRQGIEFAVHAIEAWDNVIIEQPLDPAVRVARNQRDLVEEQQS